MSEIETTQGVSPAAEAANMAATETKPESADGEKPLDPALVEKLGALRAIVKINQILSSCIVQGNMAGDILVGQEFLKQLHAPILKEAETHPDYKRATDPAGYAKELKEAKQAEQLKIRAEEKRDKKSGKKGLMSRVLGRAN